MKTYKVMATSPDNRKAMGTAIYGLVSHTRTAISVMYTPSVANDAWAKFGTFVVRYVSVRPKLSSTSRLAKTAASKNTGLINRSYRGKVLYYSIVYTICIVALLSVKNVGKHFDGNYVLTSIDLELEEGRIYQLIGPNGSGKTTLVNVIAGVLKSDTGTVIFDGHDITGKEPHDIYKYGLVRSFQIPQPFVNLNVNENLMTASTKNAGDLYRNAPLKHRWLEDEKRLQKKADDLLEMVSLTKVVNNLSSNLSGGQMKLLELGRIMMSGAKMIFMDEPIAGVNPTLAHEIFKKINKICKEHNITFLVIEHRLDISFQYVDKVFATDQGKIIASGTPDEILQNENVIESYLGV